jgi:hypothetical protein
MRGKSEDPVISAQVLLQPSSGSLPPDAEITAANVGKLRPDPEALGLVRRGFERAGFELGPTVGLSFPITARRSLFERIFRTDLAAGLPTELPLDRLPARARRGVASITFSPPPEFGPGRFD